MRLPRSLLLAASVLGVCALALAGCGAPTRAAEPPAAAVPLAAVPLAATAATATCNDGKTVDASIAPGSIGLSAGSWGAGSTMAKIKTRGYLRVATNGDVKLWGATDTNTGDPVGYDVDLAKKVAAALGVPIVYTVIPYSQRLLVLKNDQVDLVAQQMTINCARWQGVAASGSTAAAPAINLSIPYYTAGAQFLVRSNSTIASIKDLSGETVCGTKGSTSLQAVAGVEGAKTVVEATAGLCLVDFEEGEATAIVSDATTLAGFKAQDPRSKIVGTPISPGEYGLGTQAAQQDFTRFVNAVLEKARADGTLTALYAKWMAPEVGGSAPVLPAPVYDRGLTALNRQS